MIDLLTPKTAPNYSLTDFQDVLENRNRPKIAFILKNWNIMQSDDIAKKLNISRRSIYRIASGCLPKKKFIVRHRPEYTGKLVFDNETGIFYCNLPSAARANGFSITTLRDKIHYKRTNRFILA